ncbi:ring-cleaving dioxygenase [Dictyobacter aurantiacus]|uniref:Diguanylate cyclase n=1 Tax=Dictyobacter aurantiacus TaxID=1936993 RepID=A0A401ZLZ8_9CHLR|nr:ring-cleaving dioxygenase [Dictyobacter aurantiacus]GCE07850.1 diguanylate cyclase [Dictyobacter aurantiacus]
MQHSLLGIHHVTAIASDPQRNIDFYTGVLGLRLVKVTVNFDDPGSYHLYYGDREGHPGTIMTFFIWPGAPRGRQGVGQIHATAFSVPQTSLGYWIKRLLEHGIQYEGPTTRFSEQVLTFCDPDGLIIELVAHLGEQTDSVWENGTIPSEHTIRGIASVTLWEDEPEQTARLLTNTLGFRLVSEEQNTLRYELGTGESGTRVDVRNANGFWAGSMAAGIAHHVAWRAATDEALQKWQGLLDDHDYNVTPMLDRQYFHSIYFPEPGGVLFEIATDPPGFAINEPVELLGTRLQLPSWLEAQRAEIERVLPPLQYKR